MVFVIHTEIVRSVLAKWYQSIQATVCSTHLQQLFYNMKSEFFHTFLTLQNQPKKLWRKVGLFPVKVVVFFQSAHAMCEK